MNFDTFHLHFQSPAARKRNSYRRTRVSKHPEPWGSLSRESVKAILDSMIVDQREHHYRNLRNSYLKFRGKVAEWMLDLGEYFDLHPTTIHAAIAYMDRIQPNEKFCAFQWQMVAICSITIAAKYNEMEEDVPDLDSFGAIIQQEIPHNVHLEYELWVLKQMGWKLNARTPLGFLQCYDSLGIVFTQDLNAGAEFSQRQLHSGLETLRNLLNKQFNLLSTVCLLDSQFKCYPSSMIACSILYLARRKLSLEPWPQRLRETTRQDIAECQDILRQIEVVSNEFTSQLSPAMSAMTMTVSPVKIPQTVDLASSYRTPPTQSRPIAIITSREEQKAYYDEENIDPLIGYKSFHPEVSPYSVATAPSPLV